jgi:hypothetical protein
MREHLWLVARLWRFCVDREEEADGLVFDI